MIESFKLPTITPETLTGSICSFNDEYGGLPLKSCTSLISGYQEGSGTPSPDNVRPLHAFSSGTLNKTGKNLFDKSNNMGKYLDGSLTLRINAEFKSVYIELTPNTTYTYSQTESGNYKRYALANSLEEYAEFVNPVDHSSHLYHTETPFTFNSGNYKYLICTIYRISDTKTFDEIANSCQLELGQQATAYEPFGNTYTFTFGQSIYQGYIDWKRGVVVGTWGMVDLGSLTWLYNTQYANPLFYTNLVGAKLTPSAQKGDTLAEIFETYSARNMNTAGVDYAVAISEPYFFSSYNLYIVDSDYTDPTAFKTAVSGIMLAYELATPIEIPLGGINLLTQEGQNNFFCDTGDTTLEWLKVN